jgi:hypothetical protein
MRDEASSLPERVSFLFLNQFEQHHFRGIAEPWAEL